MYRALFVLRGNLPAGGFCAPHAAWALGRNGKKLAASGKTLAAGWRSGGDSDPPAVSCKLISSPVPKRLLWKRVGQSWSVCPRIFGGVKPFSRGQSPKNGDSTNQIRNTRFEEIWHTFLEKCKISCKII